MMANMRRENNGGPAKYNNNRRRRRRRPQDVPFEEVIVNEELAAELLNRGPSAVNFVDVRDIPVDTVWAERDRSPRTTRFRGCAESE